ncbi:hypothetical protein EVJ58_g7772 [Rhodofomes roseus]|uniref:F-box domain-containing protein n=1 Tax=Rhodofomes roseus TaxID=34475 RepID=A0A4Y9Y2R8_9APHY|nr:hypothetical protein EVJ58_g7772 [Rhodofomes roseus]
MRLVFSEVTVHFGAWENYEDEDILHGDELEDERSCRSFGLLNRIIVDPYFASVIRDMEVHTFKLDGVRGAFEICSLRELSSFVWHGNAPLPTAAVIESLERSCRQLRALSVPLESLDALPFERLSFVRSISISTTWPDEDLITDHSLTTAKCKTVHENLQMLEFPFHSPMNVPVNYLPNLTHLGLVIVSTLDGLGPALLQLPHLRSLSVFSPSQQEDTLFTTLSSLRRELRGLTSLALQCYDSSILPAHHAQMLANFLRDRHLLRRLYCNFEIPPESMSFYLDSVGTLKKLEVFDLRMTSQPFTFEFIAGLLAHLPAGLAAMKLTSKGSLSDASVFSQFWSHFTDFQYLYIRTWAETDIKPDAIIAGAETLQLIGYNGHFYDVEHTSGKPTLCPPWSARKVVFRNARDFGCEGWEWLMRHLTIVP